MRASELSTAQRHALVEMGEAYPDPVGHASRATAYASLARKGLSSRTVSNANRGWSNSALTPNGVALLKEIQPDLWKRVDATIQRRAFPERKA